MEIMSIFAVTSFNKLNSFSTIRVVILNVSEKNGKRCMYDKYQNIAGVLVEKTACHIVYYTCSLFKREIW